MLFTSLLWVAGCSVTDTERSYPIGVRVGEIVFPSGFGSTFSSFEVLEVKVAVPLADWASTPPATNEVRAKRKDIEQSFNPMQKKVGG
jgi:hypothetical protein